MDEEASPQVVGGVSAVDPAQGTVFPMRRWTGDDPGFVAALALAREQGGVLSRRQAYELGLPRWVLRREVRQRRWRRIGNQVVAVHTGPLPTMAHHWAAVFSGGPRALLDGASALVAAGLVRFEPDRVRVSVPRGARVRRTPRYDIRQTRRWDRTDRQHGAGVPRTRPAVAAVRAALWARSDREAVLVLSMAVQQGLAAPPAIGQELLRVRRDKRRTLLHEVVNELLDGARALGELDVARELRRRGLPAPSRQALRQDRRGRYYLDLYWPELRLVVEVDGIHHAWAENVVDDALRQNDIALSGDVVLRLPLLGLRLAPDDFFAQIARAIRSRQSSMAA
ncbi:DUF559 domain-containing protein [Nocardioides sp. GY 10127]|nr:DUF559 domain-containing protein [Nocardioides sp. GY 10127]